MFLNKSDAHFQCLHPKVPIKNGLSKCTPHAQHGNVTFHESETCQNTNGVDNCIFRLRFNRCAEDFASSSTEGISFD